jgi:hypothetical protein
MKLRKEEGGRKKRWTLPKIGNIRANSLYYFFSGIFFANDSSWPEKPHLNCKNN